LATASAYHGCSDKTLAGPAAGVSTDNRHLSNAAFGDAAMARVARMQRDISARANTHNQAQPTEIYGYCKITQIWCRMAFNPVDAIIFHWHPSAIPSYNY